MKSASRASYSTRDAPELAQWFKDKKDKKDSDLKEEDMLPPGPIKVGGSWQPLPEKMEKMFQSFSEDKMKIDAKRSSVGGKLLKAYKKDGAQFGTIEFTMTMFVTEVDYGKGNVGKATPDSKIVMTFTADVCIDGTTPGEDVKTVMTIDVTTDLANVGTFSMKITDTGNNKVRVAK